ncbi:phosphoribosyltransferase domain-containing protein [Lachnospiraceae bacterium 45-W7]
MEYQETDLVRVAKRENNDRRSYLVVNPLQGKHIPVSPGRAFAVMDALAKKVRLAYPGERLLLVGFAETATAIGARLAVALDAGYMQTTREQIPGVEYLYFTESHSHAAEQKLVKDDLDEHLCRFDRVVFVEDEVTTGNTILKIVRIMEETYPGKVRFSVASLLNGMDLEALRRYHKHGICLHYLLKTDHSSYAKRAECYLKDGSYVPLGSFAETGKNVEEICLPGYRNARRYVQGNVYKEACETLWRQIQERSSLEAGKNCLVLGTEEFMYPALYAAARLEETGCSVQFHATTRSPIEVSTKEGYPLHTRFELQSFYEEGRRTFIYDLKTYDQVLIVTDAKDVCPEGIKSLAGALESVGNEKIILCRWCEHA